MQEGVEIRSKQNVFFGNVIGFDEHGDILLKSHGKRGKEDIMTLSQFNRKARDAATEIGRYTPCSYHTDQVKRRTGNKLKSL